MALFIYKAARPGGELVEGQLEAESVDALVRQLQADGHIFIGAEVADAQPSRNAGNLRARRFTAKEVPALTAELATLLESGLPLERALTTLSSATDNSAVRTVVLRLREAVRRGESLSAALGAEGGVFSPFFVNLVRAGETSGALGQTLSRIATYQESARELRETLVSALIYPVILVVLACVSLALMLAIVVPRFAALFEDAGQALPLSTQVVMALGTAFADYWWAAIVVIAGLAVVLQRQWQNPSARREIDRWLLRVPLMGQLIIKTETTRFAQTLGTLLDNGVPLPNALGLAADTAANMRIADEVHAVARQVRDGRALASALQQMSVFPSLVARLVEIGEETGTLQPMLQRLAGIYERDLRRDTKRAVAIIEPVLIVGIGILIGGIIFSILSAVLSVNEVAL